MRAGTTTMNTSEAPHQPGQSFTSTLRLWQLISPSLPVGGFSYSQGLEQVVEEGRVQDEASMREWLIDSLRFGLARTDLPLLLRIRAAWSAGDEAKVEDWCQRLVAMRETSELRFADLSMGTALAKLLEKLEVRIPACELPFAAAFAVASSHWSVPAPDSCFGYAWSWCESQVAAAVKLVPLGHTAGQRLLLGLPLSIAAAVEHAFECEDDDIGFSMPGLAIASALHETQYTRLFRS